MRARSFPLYLTCLAAVVACGGELATEPSPPERCVDEDIVTPMDATALDALGEIVAWGDANGDVWLHERGVTRTLGSIGTGPVIAVALDGARVLAVGDAGLFAFSRAGAAREAITTSVDRPVALSARGGHSCLLERGAPRSGTLRCWSGTAPARAQGGLIDARGLALDGEAAYVGVFGVTDTTITGGRVVRVPFDGGPLVAVAVAPRFRFVVDDTSVYIAHDGASTTIVHAWFSAYPKLGPLDVDAPSTVLADDRGSLSGLDVGGSYLYATIGRGPNDEALLRHPVGGGSALTLEHLDDGSAYGELRVTERALFALVHGVKPRVEKRCL